MALSLRLLQRRAPRLSLAPTATATTTALGRALIRPMSTANAPGWDPVARPFPSARRDDALGREYHSQKVKDQSGGDGKLWIKDPYAWLEAPSTTSAETKAFVDAQAQFAQAYVDRNSDREAFKQHVEASFSYPRIGVPVRKNNGKFYLHYNSGLDPQSTIYEAAPDEIDAVPASDQSKPPGRPWFDGSLLSDKGTVALSSTSFSHTGKYVAYMISSSGSDWQTIYFRTTDQPFVTPHGESPVYDPTGGPNRLKDVLEDIKFSSARWTHDDKGVFYQTYPKPAQAEVDKGTETDSNINAQLWYHRIGTPQSADVLVVAKDPNTPEAMWSASVTDDGNYLILSSSKDTGSYNKVWLASLEDVDLAKDKLQWVPVAGKYDYLLDYVANDGERFYWITNKDAKKSKIVYTDVDFAHAATPGHVTELTESLPLVEIVPEEKDATLVDAVVVAGDKLILQYTRDVKSEMFQFNLSGQRVAQLLPDFVGSIDGLVGKREDSVAYVSTSSFISPSIIYRVSWPKDAPASTPPKEEQWLATKVPALDASEFISEQVFFPSKDGTRISLFITRHKDTPTDGTAPAFLYLYGGFNISLGPAFSPWLLSWVYNYRGVYALVNARGGGEYGEEWHEGGSLLNKTNTFDDVLGAAQYLHENKHAAKGKIILYGGSNGGLGVGACMNRALPEHGVGAGVGAVGVMDMLKFHLWTIGHGWTSDYGDPDNIKYFDYIHSYSPLHNVQDRVYPTYLLECADHDDRVVPAHSFKLAAELQHKLKHNPNPILLRVETDAGHGAGQSIQKRIDAAADRVAILGQALGLKIRQPNKL